MIFEDYCKSIDGQDVKLGSNVVISFSNKNGEVFSIDPKVAVDFLTDLQENYNEYYQAWESGETRKDFSDYDEKPYRRIFKHAARDGRDNIKSIATLGGSQTAQLTKLLVRVMSFCADLSVSDAKKITGFEKNTLNRAAEAFATGVSFFSTASRTPFQKNNKERFKAWLVEKGLSEKSIISYINTVPNKFDALISDKGFKNSFFKITSLNTLEKLFETISKHPEWIDINRSGNGMYDAAIKKYSDFLRENYSSFSLSKPFLLLAGISGTGKSRFVRQQALLSGDGKTNFKLVCVRPDWHEPADLLGYISRIGGQPEYVATDVLRFMAAAWREAFDGTDADGPLARTDTLTPYWLCLDEMNLAPVEQYFADYLSVLETRKWDDGVYRCEPLLSPVVIAQLEEAGRNKLRKDLQLEAPQWNDLWQAFCAHGMPLPPNLIVAGTVNMDETTHGFSRKVIDRAITLDFGEFFPNNFDTFFGGQPKPVTLGYPHLTTVIQADFAAVGADSDGSKTVAFLKAVNTVLAGTPFELAYRALNELLLAVVLANPADDKTLQAVWDDFLMTKVLPRIDGDDERLAWRGADSEGKTVLDGLLEISRDKLAAITGGANRPDLLRTTHDGQPLMVACRSLIKLGWMQQRLTANRFTSFWP